MRIAGIDQGTTGTKAFLFEETGEARELFRANHRQFHPGPRRVEHDPMELLRHVSEAVEAAAKAGAEILGLANQGETIVAFDRRTGRPVAPAIVWQDARTVEFVERLREAGAEATTWARAGLPLDPYFSAAKIRWILDHVEEARELRREGRLAVGTSDAFFLWHLVGRFVTDVSTASRTSLMNLATGEWDEELLALFGVPVQVLPEILPTAFPFGTVAGHPRLRLAAGVVDQQAALYGHGCRQPGGAKITFGTGAFALAHTGRRPRPDPEAGILATVAWKIGDRPLEYAIDGGVYNATSALDWARDLGLFRDYGEIDVECEETALERGLAFVPALSGLGCPYWDRSAAGLWIGLELGTKRGDLCRSVLEGVALRSAEVLARFAALAGETERLRIDGGLARNAAFCRFLAEVTGRTVEVPAFSDLTAFGAAALAARGAGLELPPPSQEVRRYRPRRDLRHLLARFGDAVSRARGWRLT